MKRNDSVILVLRAWFAIASHNVPICREDDVTVFLWTVNVVWIEGLIWGPFIVIDNRVFLDDLENVLSFKDGEDAVTTTNCHY